MVLTWDVNAVLLNLGKSGSNEKKVALERDGPKVGSEEFTFAPHVFAEQCGKGNTLGTT